MDAERYVCLKHKQYILMIVLISTVGYHAVAEIAWQLVEDKDYWTYEVLGDNSLSNISTWAIDAIQFPDWAWSRPLHYFDTPSLCHFGSPIQALNGENVIGAIKNYTQRLRDARSDEDPENQLDYLSYLIAFIVDAHQPLKGTLARLRTATK